MKKMLTNMNLSDEEIQWLNYERFQKLFELNSPSQSPDISNNGESI
jgi:hypothetical protein